MPSDRACQEQLKNKYNQVVIFYFLMIFTSRHSFMYTLIYGVR